MVSGKETASVNDMLGTIGAAKIFTSSIAESSNVNSTKTNDKIDELNEQIGQLGLQKKAETDNSKKVAIDKQIQSLQAKVKKLEKKNKLNNTITNVTSGTTDVLVKLMKACDMGKEDIIEWMTKILVNVIPAMEAPVKALLLTNFKKMVGCNIDPRIPDEWRTKGVLINESEIDPRCILLNSPLSKLGQQNYCTGIDDISTASPYMLARNTDMNAFIWYVKNCAKFVSPTIMGDKSVKEYFDVSGTTETLYDDCYFGDNKKYKFLPGCIFKERNNSKTFFICNDIIGELYQIVPLSNSWDSVNWYSSVNAWKQIANNYEVTRNYKEDRPLFSLQYSNSYDSNASFPKGNFTFKILPKPFSTTISFVVDLGNDMTVFGDLVDQGISYVIGSSAETATNISQMKWPGFKSLNGQKIARFNNKGKYDKKGLYSINENEYYITQEAVGDFKNLIPYKLVSKLTKETSWLYFNEDDKGFLLSKQGPTEEYISEMAMSEASSILTECYFGTTVYKFNYDYLMSFKLFDAKCILSNIINDLLNVPTGIQWTSGLKSLLDGRYSSNANITNQTQVTINNYVDKLVEKFMNEVDTEEFQDCFYTFSNSEYNELEKKTNEKVVNGTLLSDYDEEISAIYDMLDAYSADSDLESQTKTISNTLRQVTSTIDKISQDQSQSSNTETNSTISDDETVIDTWYKMLQFLNQEIVNQLLSPKVMMAIYINQALMGQKANDNNINKFDIKEVLSGMSTILNSVIKEVIDTLQKELLRVILSYISNIMNGYVIQLSKEYAAKWVNLLKQLLACVDLSSSSSSDSSSSGTIDSILNDIRNADIDTSLLDEIIPNTKSC